MTKNPDHCGRANGGAARRRIVPSAIALAFATPMALASSVTNADAGAREVIASSYGFADSLLPNTGLEPLLPPFLAGRDWALPCSLHCGPAFGATLVQRSDLLTSNTADLSTSKTVDSAGHPMGLGGAVVVERLEPDASGALTNWVVVSERTVDENDSHSWSLLSGAPSTAPWLPIDLYRFEGSSLSTDLLSGTPTTPETSTWAMMLIGFAGLGAAFYRRSKVVSRPIQFAKAEISR